ncbi:DUF1707 SHOCT-like domain-containing protein [Nocardioides coralli]|uniref:DUF1707 SHOCT-like domain-containing protein n=1 Tax=Nocardioides coralli TaxID=2872154 RepID=UPI001CA3AA62|nr:DUF1707 domain-containing protein [Nocardioides coralli]QZY28524.1 DUF1707 domain-containing protein [Nocardioides coralli]
MGGPLEPGDPSAGDPSRMRISDADRHKVADLLRDAAAEGRLDLDELEERLEAAYAAKTYADLVPITIDLPGHPQQSAVPAVPRDTVPATATWENSLSIMGDCTRKGAWLVPPRHNAFALMGGVTLDLREATFAARETTIWANAVMAGIDIYVDARTHVIVEGVGIMGAFDQGRDKVPPEVTADSPVVRVKGVALMAGVTVTRKGPPRAGRLTRLTGRDS